MQLDERGRCCCGKLLKYTRALREFFCDGCYRLYDEHGQQRQNFAWQLRSGEWVDVRPKARTGEV